MIVNLSQNERCATLYVKYFRNTCEFMATKLELHIGSRLRGLRKHRGLSLMKAGEIIEVSPQQIHRLETSQNQMNASQLYRFARGFNVPVNLFYEGYEEDPAELERLKIAIGENQADWSPNTGKELDDALFTAWNALPSKSKKEKVLALLEEFAFGV